MDEAELEKFLSHWRRNNERDGVTGILLYSESEHRFMQVIEGEHQAVMALFGKIEENYRHSSVLKLADGPIEQRSFTSWLMGFKVVTTAAFAQLAGYLDPTGSALQDTLARTQDELIRHLLATFTTEQAPDLRP